MLKELRKKLIPPLILETPGGARLCVHVADWSGDDKIIWAEDGWIFDSALNPLHCSTILPDERVDAETGICMTDHGLVRTPNREEMHFWNGYVRECRKHKGGMRGMTKVVDGHLRETFGRD